MIKKYLYITCGFIGLGLGAVGAALPILPCFPFLLLAAVCFGKSSKRLNDWFVSTKLYKNNLQSYMEGKGMTKKSKINVMLFITLTMSIGFILMDKAPTGRIILAVVWIFHIIYFTLKVKTISNKE